MSTGKVLLGVMAGFAAGALVGVLLAPDKGSETRKKLAKLGEDYAGDLTDKFNDLKDSISEKLGTVADDGMKIVEKGKSKLDEMKGSSMGQSKPGAASSGHGSNWSGQQS